MEKLVNKTVQREETHLNSNTAEKAACESFPRTEALETSCPTETARAATLTTVTTCYKDKATGTHKHQQDVVQLMPSKKAVSGTHRQRLWHHLQT